MISGYIGTVGELHDEGIYDQGIDHAKIHQCRVNCNL